MSNNECETPPVLGGMFDWIDDIGRVIDDGYHAAVCAGGRIIFDAHPKSCVVPSWDEPEKRRAYDWEEDNPPYKYPGAELLGKLTFYKDKKGYDCWPYYGDPTKDSNRVRPANLSDYEKIEWETTAKLRDSCNELINRDDEGDPKHNPGVWVDPGICNATNWQCKRNGTPYGWVGDCQCVCPKGHSGNRCQIDEEDHGSHRRENFIGVTEGGCH